MKTTIKIILFFFLGFSTLKAQTSLEFDGVDDVVQISAASTAAFELQNSFTVEAWIKIDTLGLWPCVVSNYNIDFAGATGFWLGIDSAGHASFECFDPTWYNAYGTTNVVDNSWHHLGGVFKNDSLFVLVDGVLEGTAAAGAPNYSSTPLAIGNDALNEIFKGKIDNIRIWNVAKSFSDIALYKDSCLTGQENNLVALYRFNEGSGDVVTDLTPNNHDGVLVNMDTAIAWQSGAICAEIVIGLIEHSTSQPFTLFPNPFSDQTILKFKNTTGATYMLRLLDLQGRLIRDISGITSDHVVIDRHDLSSGLYVYELISGGAVHAKGKLVVE